MKIYKTPEKLLMNPLCPYRGNALALRASRGVHNNTNGCTYQSRWRPVSTWSYTVSNIPAHGTQHTNDRMLFQIFTNLVFGLHAAKPNQCTGPLSLYPHVSTWIPRSTTIFYSGNKSTRQVLWLAVCLVSPPFPFLNSCYCMLLY